MTTPDMSMSLKRRKRRGQAAGEGARAPGGRNGGWGAGGELEVVGLAGALARVSLSESHVRAARGPHSA